MVPMTMQTFQQHSDFQRCHQELEICFNENPLAYKDTQILGSLISRTGVSERNIKFWFRTMMKNVRFCLKNSAEMVDPQLEERFQVSPLLDKDKWEVNLCSKDTGKTEQYIREWFGIRRRWLKIQIYIKSELPKDEEFEKLLKHAEGDAGKLDKEDTIEAEKQDEEESRRFSIELEKMLIEDDVYQSSEEFLKLLRETEEMERRIAEEIQFRCENTLRKIEFEKLHPRNFTLSITADQKSPFPSNKSD